LIYCPVAGGHVARAAAGRSFQYLQGCVKLLQVNQYRFYNQRETRSGVSFKVGDKVVYPNHGVAGIEEIREGPILGQETDFYALRVTSNETLVLVPTEKALDVGIRRLISKKDVTKLLRQLRSNDVDPGDDWKERYQENSDLMRTGEIWEVAKVLKGLAALSTQKDLSDRERRMMEKAHELVVSEIAQAEEKGEEEVTGRVDKALDTLKGKAEEANNNGNGN